MTRLPEESSIASRIERAAARLEKVASSKRLDRLEKRIGELEKHQPPRMATSLPPDYKAFARLAKQIVAEKRTLLGLDRLYVLWQAARNTAALRLPAVEIGTFRGGTARFLALSLRQHAGDAVDLHVFDTFAGHPATSLSEFDSNKHRAGQFGRTSLESVTAYLRDLDDVHIHPGDAVEELKILGDLRLSLVHLDVDLYKPTRACLDFVGDRLDPGGIIVLDDFGANKCPGIERAASEYLKGRRDFHVWYPLTEQAVCVRTSRH